MKNEDIKYFCNDLNKYLKTKYKYKRNHAYENNLTICAYTKQFDIYLRWNAEWWKEKYNNILVIARIYFREIEKGHGSSFLKFILDNADKYNYSYILIEQVNENSSVFAEKLGFNPTDNVKRKNYVISIDKLRSVLTNY